ncbi:tRNA-(MS[2]IO[6]A)-hydroxylase (MiaE)-like [Georgenia satyanarayanai]|uniref:tRNA-(MS[2]IO[6]A)-hydroxylase (MiaE)-like n=1 Tax=Georgenia satyanarayanai TaxID=860221 RepID=A0A2Y9A673_9MICO|nr:ferritin-like fold-containing protein [Georgenia satyanarayanai]PYG00555.1 tRNA-(MS[2]IO[6]A)-hydroxylase MiaE-like protein [Georgenia satyanarayanai]SSA39944.1 tRNA-(MS[2]IO[6]A)-hydroxylase (MiaE)-like [Georgenia satyanarayanai]
MPSPEPSVPALDRPEQVVTVLGLVAASRVTAFDWLAADALHAPRTQARVAVTRLASGQLGAYDTLARSAEEHGGVLTDAAAPYLELLDGIGQRTRSDDWWERVVRTVVAGGMVRDLARVVGERLPEPVRDVVAGALAGQGLTGLVAAEVAQATAGDQALSARLALWGRRVAGEALGAVQPVLDVVELAGAVDLSALAAPAVGTVSADHARRMQRLGLAA